ncbi:MAG: translation initiation factor IF-3 [Candidatus Magasanikbacteria bacterium]
MRISRKKRSPQLTIPHFDVNEKIRSEQVRLISDEGNIGVMSTRDALEKAREEGMDLVIINPKAEPPIAKIIEFSHFKYQKEKEAKKQKVNAHVTEVKGIRLSIRIGVGDLSIRVAQADKFLKRGDKVRPEIILRGREHGKVDLAFEVLKNFYNELAQTNEIKYEQNPEKQANKITAIITHK